MKYPQTVPENKQGRTFTNSLYENSIIQIQKRKDIRIKNTDKPIPFINIDAKLINKIL